MADSVEWRKWLTAEALNRQWGWHEAGKQGPGRLVLEGKDLRGLSVAHLRGVRLVRCDLTGARMPRLLEDIELVGCTLDGAQLGSAALERAKIDDCRFVKADLSLVNMSDAQIRIADFTDAEFENSTWSRATVKNGRFSRARLVGAQLDDAAFSGCDFRAAKLTRNRPVFDELGTAYATRFEDCDLRDADVDGLRIRGTKLVRCAFAGVHGKPAIEGPYTVTDPDLSTDRDGSAAPADQIYALWG